MAVYAWDNDNGIPKTGDAANITGQLSKNGNSFVATTDVNPTEIGYGVYVFNMSQSETNADLLVLSASSTTLGVVIQPVLANTLYSPFAWIKTA